MTEVTDFITRLEQGYTEAFECRARDTHVYVTKSIRAGREALIKEVIAGRVGRELGLPIPPFDLLYVTDRVARQSVATELSDLSVAPGFGSRRIDATSTLNVADVPSVDADLQRRVLLFDWWLCNEDRTDHNPNLLWDPLAKSLHVIDHNLTFAPDLAAGRSTDVFWGDHVFRSARPALADPAFRAAVTPTMDAVLAAVPGWWAALPDEWTADVAGVTLELIASTLGRCRADPFWTP